MLLTGAKSKRNIILLLVVEGILFVVFTYLVLYNPFKQEDVGVKKEILHINNEKLTLIELNRYFNNTPIELSIEGRKILEGINFQSDKIRCMFVFGTLSEYVRLQSIIKELHKYPQTYEIFIIYSGERDISHISKNFNFFGLRTHVNINVQQFSNDPIQMSSKIVSTIDVYIKSFFPHVMIVQGQSLTTFSGATAGYLNKIPIGHIDSGLRSKDLRSPMPDEFSRKSAGLMCSFCFTNSIVSNSRLLEEGISKDRIFYVGAPIVNALQYTVKKNEENNVEVEKNVNTLLSKIGQKLFVVVTLRERSDMSQYNEIVNSVSKLSTKFSPSVHFFILLEGSSELFETAEKMFDEVDNVSVFSPLVYNEFIMMIGKAHLVVTDSSTIQEECSELGVPSIVVQEKSERIEKVIDGSSIISRVESSKIVADVERILNNKDIHNKMTNNNGKLYTKNTKKIIEKIVQIFDDFFVHKKKVPKLKFTYDVDVEEKLLDDETIIPGSIGVILTVWKRSYTLEVLKNLYEQTVKPTEIWIWQNENHVSIDDVLKKYPEVKVVQSSANLKFHGRFALPLLMRTEYIAIYDDDLIPGKRWFESCVRVVNQYNAIAGANGRRVKLDATKYGDAQQFYNKVKVDTEVDFIGHIWFFKRKWIRYLWREPVPTYDSGEDISFSAAVQIHGGISAYIPGQPSRDYLSHLKNFGGDKQATFVKDRSRQHRIRYALFNYWRSRGWSLYNERH